MTVLRQILFLPPETVFLSLHPSYRLQPVLQNTVCVTLFWEPSLTLSLPLPCSPNPLSLDPVAPYKHVNIHHTSKLHLLNGYHFPKNEPKALYRTDHLIFTITP